MPATVTRREFAAAHGVARQVVDRAITAGRLIAAPGGGLDPAHPVNAAYGTNPHHSAAGAADVAAKVAAFTAKARLLRHRLDEEEAGLVERDAYLRDSLARVPTIHAWLTSMPERRAGELAAALGCPVETARDVLTELIGHITEELGDIGADMTATIMAA